MDGGTLALRRLQPATGRLLVAGPGLLDPNFAQTIVMLLDVDEGGALGVVLNRPSEIDVHAVLSPWSPHVDEPGVVFVGGPVGTDSALGLARSVVSDRIEGWRGVTGGLDLGLIDLDAPTEVVGPALADLRIFAGYAGWSAAQLDQEIAQGAWFVVPGESTDVFSDPDSMWARVLGRQRGELAMLATLPRDPQLN